MTCRCTQAIGKTTRCQCQMSLNRLPSEKPPTITTAKWQHHCCMSGVILALT